MNRLNRIMQTGRILSESRSFLNRYNGRTAIDNPVPWEWAEEFLLLSLAGRRRDAEEFLRYLPADLLHELECILSSI